MSFFAELKQLEDKGIDLIEVLGQDRHLASPDDLQEIISHLSRSGESLYSELLYYLTYRRFPQDQAENLWKGVMKHKRRMQEALTRDVAFRVAALDYLSCKTNVLKGVHLIARPEFEGVLSYVNIDEVSGVFSRRYFNTQLSKEVSRARRYGKFLSLLLIDVDRFKQINDSFGHVKGDTVLRKVGRLLQDSTRQADSVCRFGGDEFSVLLPETNSSDAYSTAERTRNAVSQMTISKGRGEDIALTLSVGGATFPGDCDEAEELMALADQMCLEAKRAGKNCVKLYSEGHRQPL